MYNSIILFQSIPSPLCMTVVEIHHAIISISNIDSPG